MNVREWAKDADVLLSAYPDKPRQRRKLLAEYFEAAFREGAKREVEEIISEVDERLLA